MPIREFYCNDCNETSEYLLLPREDTRSGVPCKSCGSRSTQAKTSAAAFKFARGGFSASSVDLGAE